MARKTASVSLELLSQSLSILSIARGGQVVLPLLGQSVHVVHLCVFGLAQLRVWTAGVSEVVLPTSSAALFLVAHSPLCTTSFWGSTGVRKKERKRERKREKKKRKRRERERKRRERKRREEKTGKDRRKGKG